MKKMLRLVLAVGLSAACVLTVGAQAPERQVRFTTHRLANGLRVVLAPDEREATVAVNVSFDAGSGRERRAQAGAARLLQKIMLANLRRASEGAGGAAESFEGVVNPERASYFSEFEAGRLEAMLASFARAWREPGVGRARVDEQRPSLEAECRESEGRRFGRVQEALLDLLYREQAHRHGAVCLPSDVEELTAGAVESFFRTFYVPNNAVLVVVGKFRADEALELLEKNFGRLGRRAVPRRAADGSPPLKFERRRVIVEGRAGAATYMSAYVTVPSDHADWYALNILADIVGQGEESRLHTALVAKKLATSVPEGVAESRGRSLFRVGAALAPDVHYETAEAAIDSEFERIRKDGVTEAEVERARSQERRYAAEQLGTPLGRAGFLSRNTLYYDDPNRINKELGRLLAVTAEDVRRVARKYLSKTNRAVVVARPAR